MLNFVLDIRTQFMYVHTVLRAVTKVSAHFSESGDILLPDTQRENRTICLSSVLLQH